MHKNEIRPGYKNSKVGWIPNDWECQPLCKLGVKVIDGDRGINYPGQSEFFPAEYCLFLNAGNVTSTGFRFTEKQFISKERDELLRKGKLQRGDLVVTTRGTIGNFAHYTNNIPYDHIRINSGMAILRSDNNKIDTAFIAHYFFSSIFEKELRRVTFGSAIPQLTIGLIQQIHLPVSPSLFEQKAIAGVLECWDRGIRNFELKIEKKRLIKNGLMQRLLSGKQRLKGFSEAWKRVRLGDVTTPRKERIDSRQEGIQTFCIDLEHIESETGKLLGHTSAGDNASLKTVFQRGDILFGKLRAYLRKYWLTDRTGVCSTEIWVLPPNKTLLTSQYLFQIIKTDLFIDAANSTTGTHMPRSDWDTVKNYTFGLPPIDEQQAIAGVLSAADREIESLEKKLALWKEQKKYLLNNLVTGTIRLPEFGIMN